MKKSPSFFQKKYPRFIYHNFFYQISNKNLKIFFNFEIEPDIFFKPQLIIKNIPLKRLIQIDKKILENLIFHLGLIETLSYWKSTCSPEILIKAGFLNRDQIKWWKKLIIKGMGQFFYENKINFKNQNFIKITSLSSRPEFYPPFRIETEPNQVLIAMGEGRNSVVTLELLKKEKIKFSCFSLNPTFWGKKILKIAGCKELIIVNRSIDKKLLELNQKGFLNGHTPFSAYLAFLGLLLAVIFSKKYLLFSNERSANEGNLRYLEEVINHQWSKSFEFEEMFREYSKQYLAQNIEYFSFLRPLYDLQVSKIFSKFKKYFSTFFSCNAPFKISADKKSPILKWCNFCPKCLFVFASLFPFIEEKKLIKIFKENLFEKKELLPMMEELIGFKKFKPFECVGTKKENLIAFYLSWKKANRVGNLPFLLKYFENIILPKYPNLKKESKKIMEAWNNQHNLSPKFKKILTKVLKVFK